MSHATAREKLNGDRGLSALLPRVSPARRGGVTRTGPSRVEPSGAVVKMLRESDHGWRNDNAQKANTQTRGSLNISDAINSDAVAQLVSATSRGSPGLQNWVLAST